MSLVRAQEELQYDGGDEDDGDQEEIPDAPTDPATANIINLTEEDWDEEPCLPLVAQGLREDDRESAANVENVLHEFGGRHGGSRVSLTEGVPIIGTALQFFM